jgi:hypothetical protein
MSRLFLAIASIEHVEGLPCVHEQTLQIRSLLVNKKVQSEPNIVACILNAVTLKTR